MFGLSRFLVAGLVVSMTSLIVSGCSETDDSLMGPSKAVSSQPTDAISNVAISKNLSNSTNTNKSKLPVPANIHVAVSDGTVAIHWDVVPQAIGYQLVFSGTQLLSDQKVQNSPVTLTGVPNGQYSVKIRALVDAGNPDLLDSPFSDVQTFAVGTVTIDTTPPSLTASVAPSMPNIRGWYNTPVMLHYDAIDPESGIASVSPDQIVTTEGNNQVFTGSATNNAGLTSTVTTRVSVDRTAPAASIFAAGTQVINNVRYVVLGSSATFNGSVSDALSGIASASFLVNGMHHSAVDGSYQITWTPSTTGTYTFQAAATDNADNNVRTPELSIVAAYQFNGWRPPVSLVGKVHKSGSTLPVKFLVVDANGTPITSGLNVRVSVGTASATAVLDDASIGQWKAEVVLQGSGTQTVSLSGNITPASLAISVK